MLKKLYKHEFHSLFRVILPIYAGLFFMALLTRLTQLMQSENIMASILEKSTVVLYVLGILATSAIVMVVIVTRFYKNLLSKEGYLTFSLPLRAADHLNCKLICSIAVLWLTVVALCGSLVVIFVGKNVFTDFLQAVRYLWEFGNDVFNAGQIIIMIVETVIALFCYTAFTLLMFYGALCIGQQFKKRIGAAVLTGFIIYSVMQTVGAVLIAIGAILHIDEWITKLNLSLFAMVCSVLGAVIIWYGVWSLALYLISRHLLTEKLNLQ